MDSVLMPEFIGDFFSLQFLSKFSSTQITMQVTPSVVNTVSLPHTYKILSQRLPSIHTSLCFNDKKLPFAKEVRRTEVGHLFEHILLENIYRYKVSLGHTHVSVRGETSWNWNKYPIGFFLIMINIGNAEKDILSQALVPSIQLLQFIFAFHKRHQAGVKFVPFFGKNFTPRPMLPTFTLAES